MRKPLIGTEIVEKDGIIHLTDHDGVLHFNSTMDCRNAMTDIQAYGAEEYGNGFLRGYKTSLKAGIFVGISLAVGAYIAYKAVKKYNEEKEKQTF